MNKLLLLNYSLQQHGTDLGQWGLNWERYFKRVLICLGNIRSRLIWQWLIWLNTPEFVIKHNICIHIGRNNIGGITQGISKFIGPLGDMKNIVLIRPFPINHRPIAINMQCNKMPFIAYCNMQWICRNSIAYCNILQ